MQQIDHREMQNQDQQAKVQKTKKQWESFTSCYKEFDDLPQTFQYTLVNMLDLSNAKNILEIGCGAGRNLPYVMQLKNSQAAYYATDLSEQMVKAAKNRLFRNFERYQSTLSFEQWCKIQKIEIEQANGQEPYQKGLKFDRIICNLVLMLTPHPQKMIQSMFKVAEEGCLLGITIWGDKKKNNLLNCVDRAMVQHGYPQQEGKFYLFRKIEEMLQKYGWQIVLNWEQNGAFSITDLDENNQAMQQFLYIPLNFLQDETTRIKIKSRVKQLHRQILASKSPFLFSGQLLVVKKKHQ